MPTRPRQYNNQRPLNPRHQVNLPLGGPQVSGRYTVISAILNSDHNVQWILDANVTSETFGRLRISQPITDDSTVQDIYDNVLEPVEIVEQTRDYPVAGQMVVVLRYEGDAIDVATQPWVVDPGSDGDPADDGRLLPTYQMGILTEP